MAAAALVADASVVAKWFLEETGSDRARALRDAFATGRLLLWVPALLYYEVAQTLRLSGVFASSELRAAARALSKYGFRTSLRKGRLLEEATNLAREQDVSVYDAADVALARLKRTRLITPDEELLRKFPGLTRRL